MNGDMTVQDAMDREHVGASESDELTDTVELLLRNEAETAVVQRGLEEASGFADQSICERCGTFAGDLSSVNQLVCTDCAAM